MIRAARDAGAWIVKFQKRHPELREDWKAKPYDSPHSYGRTYLEHRQALEFSAEQHAELWNVCGPFEKECLLDLDFWLKEEGHGSADE